MKFGQTKQTGLALVLTLFTINSFASDAGYNTGHKTIGGLLALVLDHKHHVILAAKKVQILNNLVWHLNRQI